MLNNVECQQDATPEGVAHWLHLSLTVSTGIAAVSLLLHVWNRQIEKRGDRFDLRRRRTRCLSQPFPLPVARL